MTDKEYMQIAIDISKTSRYPYGAIVVRDDKIIGRSDAGGFGDCLNSLFSHAELAAIENATTTLYGGLVGATLYASCEPCPMCMGAILYEGISKLVYACTLKDSIKYNCKEVLVPCEKIASLSGKTIEIIPNLLREEALKVLENYKFEEE